MNSPMISGIAGMNVPDYLSRSRGYVSPQRETSRRSRNIFSHTGIAGKSPLSRRGNLELYPLRSLLTKTPRQAWEAVLYTLRVLRKECWDITRRFAL